MGSCSLPLTSRVTTCGLPTVSSKPSRRMISTSTASCSSPRPCTSHASGRSVGSTRSETLPISSASRRALTWLAVSFLPLLPFSGEVLIPIVIERLGSSMCMTGSGRGSSASEIVSPIVTSGRPARAMISPGPASSASTRSSCSVTVRFVILTRSIVPSARHHEACWLRVIVPWKMRQIASRPRYGDASRFVTKACSGWPSS